MTGSSLFRPVERLYLNTKLASFCLDRNFLAFPFNPYLFGFLLPTGFRSSFVTTGNSSFFRSLVSVVHDGGKGTPLVDAKQETSGAIG